MESGARFPSRSSFFLGVPSLLIFLPLKDSRPITGHNCDHHNLPILISPRNSTALISLSCQDSLGR